MGFLSAPILGKPNVTCPGKLRDQDPCFRAVVFSQFTSFLDLIQMALEREHFDLCRFDGTMDVKKKAAAITEFKSQSRKPKVLIVSLKAGGVGLNVCNLRRFASLHSPNDQPRS